MTTRTESFAEAARAVHAEVTTATAAGAAALLDDLVEAPAVGTPLPYRDVRLPEAVETDPSPSEFADAETGVTPAAFGVADYGSVVIASSEDGEEPASLFPERHVSVLAASDLVEGLPEAVQELAALAERGRDAVVATGPSATADMGELVVGAHGPREAHVVVLEDR